MNRSGAAVGVAVLVGVVGLAAGCGPAAGADPAKAGPAAYEVMRRTAVVEVYQACKDSVVNIGCSQPDPKNPSVRHTEFASGVVLHPAGFILTNAHLLRRGGDLAVGFEGGRDYPARIVAVDERRDLAVLKIEPDRPLKPIRLGRSQGLMVGERVITMGNPFGMGLTVGEGIISALGRSTQSEYTFYPDMIQTDATTNPGSSGGPLLNVSGEMVGLNTTKKIEADNIAFAIPVDRIRRVLPQVLAAEDRYGFTFGAEVATLGPAEVTAVRKGSPAEAAGLRPGDVVIRVGEWDVRQGIDFYLALVGRRGGEPVPVRVLRGGRLVALTVVPKARPLASATEGVEMVAGLERLYYEGRWDRLPALDRLRPAAVDHAAAFDLGPYNDREAFALVLRGFLLVPADGVYAFYVESDDGSRLTIGGRVVVDNDGVHEPRRRRGFIGLAKGPHAVRLEYFNAGGEARLEVSWHGDGEIRRPVPAEVLFRRAAGPAPKEK